jgi:FkbM family methyltransferase
MEQGARMQALGRRLHHYDPAQLLFQLAEIVGERTYLRHGVTVGPGDVVLDVGANVGVAAAFFASECQAQVVHSFEPVPPVFELLQENVRQFPTCVAHPYGLSSTAGTTSITYYPHAAAMSGLYADPNEDRLRTRQALINSGMSESDADRDLDRRYEAVSLPCELRTLSSVLHEESLERVDLLKIDVEKAELDVIRGIEEADWPRIQQVAIEVHEDDHCAAISEELGQRGFSVATEQESTMRGIGVHMLYGTRQ